MSNEFKAGYVALVGRPSAGKSTLMNRLLGTKLAITSSKPQTTRDRIQGVHTDEQMQVVFVDTPGIHEAWTELNKVMVSRAQETLAEVDLICWLEDMALMNARMKRGEPLIDEGTQMIIDMLEASGGKVVMLANKIDKIPPQNLLPLIDAFSKATELKAILPISATEGDGVPELMKLIAGELPASPHLFPPDYWTDRSERFMCSELLREKVFAFTKQEIPYSTFVEVEKFDEEERDSRGLVKIYMTVVVERPQQKRIVIGRGGEMIKRIASAAREEMEQLLDCKVFLEVFVKVEPGWTKSRSGLRKVGFER